MNSPRSSFVELQVDESGNSRYRITSALHRKLCYRDAAKKSGTTESSLFVSLEMRRLSFYFRCSIAEREEINMSKIPYNHKAIEKKWRDKWEENPVNVQFDENGKKVIGQVGDGSTLWVDEFELGYE